MTSMQSLERLRRALLNSNSEEFDRVADLVSQEFFANPAIDAVTLRKFADELFEVLRLSVLPKGANYIKYPTIQRVVLNFAGVHGDKENFSEHMHLLFIYPEQLISTFFAVDMGAVISHAFIYAEAADRLAEFFKTEGFCRWAVLPGKINFLKGFLKHSVEFLLQATLHQCPALFAAQVRLVTSLSENFSELADDFARLVDTVALCQEKVFNFWPDEKRGLLETIQGNSPCRQSMMAALSSGRVKTQLPELTVEALYREALKEIMADAILSPEEEEAIRNLREFVPIAPDRYQAIFERNLSENVKPDADAGDFDPNRFIRNLIRNYGPGLDDAGKDLIINAGNALFVSQAQIRQLLQEIPAGKAGAASVPADEFLLSNPVYKSIYQRIVALKNLEVELKNSNEFLRVCHRAEELFDVMRKSATDVAPGCESSVLERSSVLGFCFDSASMPIPTMIYFCCNFGVEYTRIQFKGNTLRLKIRAPIEEMLKIKSPFLEGGWVHISNCDVDRDVDVGWVCTDGLGQFAEGLRRSNGHYRIVLAEYQSKIPFKLLELKGGVDTTGRYDKADGLFCEGKFNETLRELQTLEKDCPYLVGVSYMIGRTYRTMAQKNINPAQNYALAEKNYRNELVKVPQSVDAMLGLGIIFKQQGRFVDAESWFEKALAVSPACIPVRVTYATTRMSRMLDEEAPIMDILNDLCVNLASCYLTDPDSAVLKQVDDYLSDFFKHNFSELAWNRCVDLGNM